MYTLNDHANDPVFVKYDEGISYIPVFESLKSATDAASALRRSNADAIVKTNGVLYTPNPFSWEMYRCWREKFLLQNVTLFIYPMAPKDYGYKEKE